MPPHVFLCAYNNIGYKNEKFLSSYIYCVQFSEQNQIKHSCNGLSDFLLF